VYHAPGNDGSGSAGYIDDVILRDKDADTDWDVQADGTLEERIYCCQNWRHDVVALVDASGGGAQVRPTADGGFVTRRDRVVIIGVEFAQRDASSVAASSRTNTDVPGRPCPRATCVVTASRADCRSIGRAVWSANTLTPSGGRPRPCFRRRRGPAATGQRC